MSEISTALKYRAERQKIPPADDFQTPPWVLNYLVPYLPFGSVVWEPCCGKGNLVTGINSLADREDLAAFGTDIALNPLDDALTYSPSLPWDILVTNPPFTLKDEFIARAYELGKPFALLLPGTALLEGQGRHELFRKHGVQIILLPRRVKFTTPSGKVGGCWFPVAWFTNGLNLPRDIEVPFDLGAPQ